MQLPAADKLTIPLFLADENGTLTYANTAWQLAIGTGPGDHWQSCFVDTDTADYNARWRRCLHELEPFQATFATRSTDNGPHWYDAVCQPATGKDGSLQVLGWLTDITRQHTAIAETMAILQTAVDPIIIIDEHGTIETVNQAATDLFGYSQEQLIGQPVTRLMPEPDRAQHDQYLRNYLTTGEKRIIGIGRELKAVDHAGNVIPIHLTVSEIEGSERRFTGIMRDLTEQHRTRHALVEQREKLAHVSRLSTMGEMTASIAHEINQPLTAISMYAQASLKLLAKGKDSETPEKLRDALTKLNTQSLRAGAVIERIQRFARSQETLREIVNINELIVDLMKLAESDALLHDIELDLDLTPDLPMLFCDSIQVQQVALNLIRNGIDAMTEIGCRNGRSITISSRLNTRDQVEVAFRDSGPGVAEDQTDLVFAPFHTTKKQGMGMGLSICRSIIAEHAGVLMFSNNEPEPGATFYFTLPVYAPPSGAG